jgi:hypothetical protein
MFARLAAIIQAQVRPLGEQSEAAMNPERQVVDHYTQRRLERAALQALAAAGKDPDRLLPEDLAPVEEFHTGGRGRPRPTSRRGWA